MKQSIREHKSRSKALQATIDGAVKLADREIGINQPPRFGNQSPIAGVAMSEPGHVNTQSPIAKVAADKSRNVSSTSSVAAMATGKAGHATTQLSIAGGAGLSAAAASTSYSSGSMFGNRQWGVDAAPINGIEPTPPPDSITVNEYAERIRAGWVPVMGLPGTPITSGFVRDLGEYNPKLEGVSGIWTYQEMRRGDGQVAGTLRACKMPILSAKWQIVPGEPGVGSCDSAVGKAANSQLPSPHSPVISSTGAGVNTAAKAKEVADFVRDNLFSNLEWQDHRGCWHTQNWKDVVRYALRMQDFGAACYEEVVAIDGGCIRLRRLCDRQALTFYRWHTDPHIVDPELPPFVYDDGETLYALEQWGYRGNRFESVLLPANKACIFTHDQEGANFWGIPLTRAMYPHWFVKKHLERIDAIACERNSLGVPMIMLPPNPSRQDVQTAQSWVTQLAAHEKTGLSLPNGAEFKLVGIEGRIREILPSIQYHKQQIATSCLAMFMELGQTQTGSRSLGESQTDFFMLATQNTADYIAHQIRNSTIRRLVEWNYGPDAPVPHLIAANVQARSIDSMAAIIAQLAGAGAWVSDRDSVNQARHELGFNDYEDEESEKTAGN